MIKNLLPKPREIIEQSIMFNESMRGFGFRCTVLVPENIELPDLGYHQDIGYNDSKKFIAYISIDSHPRPKLLQSLGWITEDDDTKPMVCYISRYLQLENYPREVNSGYKEILPTKYTKLLLEYDYQDLGKEFIVTKVSSNSFNPVYYIMMIVPYRPNVPVNTDPLRDHNLDRLDVQETHNDLRFLNSERFKTVGIKF